MEAHTHHDLSWIGCLAAIDEGLQAVQLWATQLTAAERAQLKSVGLRICACSEQVAVRFLASAPGAFAHFGAQGFFRWAELGASLLIEAPRSDAAALSYFGLSPRDFGPGGLLTAHAWCELGRVVSARARHLSAAFFSNTGGVLAADAGRERLRDWAMAGLALVGHDAWQAGVVLEQYLANAPATVFATSQHALWLAAALSLYAATDPQRFFATPPGQLCRLTDDEQALFLRSIARLARLDVDAASGVYAALPEALHSMPGRARAALLELLAALDEPALQALAQAPADLMLGLRGLPAAQRASSLQRVAVLAASCPQAAVAALAVLPRLHAHAGPEQIARWFDSGTRMAFSGPAAAKAYFALESRSCLGTLFAATSGVRLEPELGVWCKFIEMASAQPAIIRRTTVLSLRPALEADPARGEVELPERSDWLASREDNRAVLRFLALQLAGRRQFGTYARGPVDACGPGLQELFLVAEGVRVQHRIGLAYPGTIEDTRALARVLLETWEASWEAAWEAGEPQDAPSMARVCDVLLAVALAQGAAALPRKALGGLTHAQVDRVVQLLASLRSDSATVSSSLVVARQLAGCFAGSGALMAAATPPFAGSIVQPAHELGTRALFGAPSAGRALQPRGDSVQSVNGSGVAADDAEFPSLVDAEPERDTGDTGDTRAAAPGDPPEQAPRVAMPVWRRRVQQSAQSFVYDEWDHSIADYRPEHCRVYELPLTPDSGAFFEQTLREAHALHAQVRRQFEQMRPQRYRRVFGLSDGEDFDLNALTDARIDARRRRTARTRIYTSRVRQARDVATLFLLDMSASTEQPYPEPLLPPPRRIIDTLKEALVIMTAALEKLGDQYAIYGFSSRGRDQVEVYPVKAFDEVLDHSVKARIGGIQPKSGTRMGAALRHMIQKFSRVSARSKHLILLSDGFPQDHDYGADRRSHTYGIADTAVALRELNAKGPVPFCITVDRAGHDYLRLMCDASQYLVIDDIDALPRELPKIYRRLAQG